MTYHCLPRAFVANDYLCEFLLAYGLKETTSANPNIGPGCRDFEKGEGGDTLTIVVNQMQAEIEVYGPGSLDKGCTSIPAAAMVLLVTMDYTQPRQQVLFRLAVAELDGAAWRDNISEMAVELETQRSLSSAAPTQQLAPTTLPHNELLAQHLLSLDFFEATQFGLLSREFCHRKRQLEVRWYDGKITVVAGSKWRLESNQALSVALLDALLANAEHRPTHPTGKLPPLASQQRDH